MTTGEFGGLSNMAPNFPLEINDIHIATVEGLYQACRFPNRPDIQALILDQQSPMTAKMKSKKYRKDTRDDWDGIRVKIMRWCLRIKLAQNWVAFSALLLKRGARPIVEESRKDEFWGAKPQDDGTLVGMNVLGRLLMELREQLQTDHREELMGPVAVAAQFAPLFSAFPDWHWAMRNLVADDNYIAVHFTVTGTHRGTFQGIEATGRRVTTSELTLYRLEDGKFAEVWDHADMDAVMRQIGQNEARR